MKRYRHIPPPTATDIGWRQYLKRAGMASKREYCIAVILDAVPNASAQELQELLLLNEKRILRAAERRKGKGQPGWFIQLAEEQMELERRIRSNLRNCTRINLRNCK